MSKVDSFQLAYHLVGEQAIPVYLSAVQFPRTTRHILLTSRARKTQMTADRIIKALDGRSIKADVKYLGEEKTATSFETLGQAIRKALDITNPRQLPAAFNITGGTKPMSILSLVIADELKWAQAFYCVMSDLSFFWLTKNEHTPIERSLSLEEFIQLGGLTVKHRSEGECPPGDLLNLMMRRRKLIQRFQLDFARIASQHQKDEFFRKYKEMLNELKKEDRSQWELLWGSMFKAGASWERQAKLLAGHWLEYYVWHKMKSAAKILEIGCGIELYPSAQEQEQREVQEFDVAYTDGFHFIILECKAGRVNQDHFQKLENLRNRFAGALGKSALVSLNSLRTQKNTMLRVRIESSRSIAAFCEERGIDLLSQGDMAFTFAPGIIYPSK